MKIYSKLESIRVKRGAVAIALLDPDTKNDNGLKKMVNIVNNSDFDAIFIGGSLISDNEFESRIKIVKQNTDLPVIIFPGSSNQISRFADAVLFLSLFLPVITRDAPASPSPRAMPSPIPPLPPVTTATFPARLNNLIIFSQEKVGRLTGILPTHGKKEKWHYRNLQL